MSDGYHSKMLLYALDKLFYVYVQIKNSRREDDKLMLAYEILCISANRCTDRQNGIEKTGVPDALALLNVNDVRHPERLAWAVYDGRTRDGHSHGLSPHTPSRCHQGVTPTPCTPLRCCCNTATSHDVCTTPKVV